MAGLTEDELERLHKIGTRIRYAKPDVKLDTDTDYQEGNPYYSCDLKHKGATMGSIYHKFVVDGLMFANARSDELFMLQLIRRLADELEKQEKKE